MPWLGALVCNSLFDIALHDAYGNLHERDVYTTYNGEWMNRSLEHFLEPAADVKVDVTGKYPEDFLKRRYLYLRFIFIFNILINGLFIRFVINF